MKRIGRYFLVIFILYLPFQSRADYLRYRMTIIENGGFESIEPETESLGAYWLMNGRGGLPEIPRDRITNLDAHEGQYCLYVTRGDSIWQYLPGVQEYSDSLKICGAVKLTGDSPSVRLHVTSGDGLSVVYCMEVNPNPPQDDSLHAYIGVVVPTDAWTTFELPAGKDFLNGFGVNPLPCFTLMLEGISDICLFDAFDVTTDFYTLSPEEFRDRILDEMEWTFELWIEYGLDREGTENTPCVSHLHDALTGEEVETLSMCPVWASYPVMVEYLKYRENSEYRQLVIDQADLFLRTRHRTTGFMRYWNPATDEPTGDVALLPISYFWQVYDLTGDAKYRDAALEMTDTVLVCAERAWDTEPIPEGYLQSGYNTDGTVRQLHENQYQIMIRWFDIVRFLAEAYDRNPDPRYLEAMENCAELYITPGIVQYADIDPSTINFEPTWYDWRDLVPAFDDYFGYGIQGLWRVWKAGGFAHEGIKAYLNKAFADMGAEWRKAMYLGGREAGDEFRAWWPYFWAWQHDAGNYSDHREYLERNGYTVMKGEFGEYGSWLATAYKNWSPIIGLPGEGATTGASGNALSGLFMAWEVSGRHDDFYAAMVSLFRTSQLTYKFDYGYIREPTPNLEGANIAGGEFRYLDRWFDLFEALGFTQVKESDRITDEMPEKFHLYQNYPNPFNPTTTINFSLPQRNQVTLKVFNLLGEEVLTLVDGELPSGKHSIIFNATEMASGIYFYQLKTTSFMKLHKMILLQ